MSTTIHADPPLPRGPVRRRGRRPTSFGRGFRGLLAAAPGWLGRAIATEIALRRSIRELAAMSERELHDLGLSRGEVAHVARHGRG